MEICFCRYDKMDNFVIETGQPGRFKTESGWVPFPIVTTKNKDEFRSQSGDFKDYKDDWIFSKKPTAAQLKKLGTEFYQIEKNADWNKAEIEKLDKIMRIKIEAEIKIKNAMIDSSIIDFVGYRSQILNKMESDIANL